MADKNDSTSDEPERKPPEKHPPAGGGSNLLWYLLGAGAITVLLANLVTSRGQVEIPYGTLVRLIDQGSPDKTPEASLEVSEGAGDRRETIRYSNLTDLQIGPEEITGAVTRQVISPQSHDAEPNLRFRTARRGLENDTNALLNQLRRKGFDDVRAESPASTFRTLAPVLIFSLLLVGVFFFVLRRVGGTGSAVAFGRSRGRLYAQEDLGVTFDDVAGIDEAVEEVREVVEFLKSPEKYRVLGGRIPKGVLLVGPPGTGKTLLAKAIAGEAGVPFFCLSGSDFVEMFVGVGAARVRDMFQQAQSRSPCIVFIDELDALGKTRGTSVVGGHDEREQTLNALLVEMDGFSTNSGVIVMAATNRPETLDPALLRPGRFDRQVLVDRPDIRGREAILAVHVKNIKVDESVDIKEVASITPGFVGADLANLVNEAALLAARNGKPAVTMEEFNEGVERVVAGLEKKQRIMSREEKRRVAYHESGHALVAYSLPNTDPVHKVSIIPRGVAALGYTLQRPEGDRYVVTQSELESRIQVLLAGTMAEELMFDEIATGAQSDLERATEIARSMVMDFGMSRLGRVNYRESSAALFLDADSLPRRERCHSEQTAREIDEELKRILDDSLDKVRTILEGRRQALTALAERLIEKETIDTEEFKQLMEANCFTPIIVPGTAATSKHASAGKGDACKESPIAEPGG